MRHQNTNKPATDRVDNHATTSSIDENVVGSLQVRLQPKVKCAKGFLEPEVTPSNRSSSSFLTPRDHLSRHTRSTPGAHDTALKLMTHAHWTSLPVYYWISVKSGINSPNEINNSRNWRLRLLQELSTAIKRESLFRETDFNRKLWNIFSLDAL